MEIQNNANDTYRRLRRAIGYLGIGLPLVLVCSSLIGNYVPIQPSMSQYYYTPMRDILVGVLCAIGLFLIRYKGFGGTKWWLNDNFLTNIAGIMAFGVALFPTNPVPICIPKMYSLILDISPFLDWLHFGFAVVLFLIMAWLCIRIFTIGHKRTQNIPESKLNENNIYISCGVLILLFIVMIPIFKQFVPNFHYTTLVFEGLALSTFGISWLIKGRALGDTGRIGEMLYGERNE